MKTDLSPSPARQKCALNVHLCGPAFSEDLISLSISISQNSLFGSLALCASLHAFITWFFHHTQAPHSYCFNGRENSRND